MFQLVNQQAHQIVSQGPERANCKSLCGFATLRAKPRNMCTYQYTKKNNHTTREVFDKANANGACLFLTTSVHEILYAMWEHEVAALKPRKRKAWKGHVSDVCGQTTVVVYCT